MKSFTIHSAILIAISYCASASPLPGTVSVGNSFDTTVAASSGQAGIFSRSGVVDGVISSSNNQFRPNSVLYGGNFEMGNTRNVKVGGSTGDGMMLGRGGDVVGLQAASGNGASGGSYLIGNLINSNAMNTAVLAQTGKGGSLGGKGGDVAYVGTSNQNYVNLNNVNGGQVGVTSGGALNANAGMGRFLGNAGSLSNIIQSTNNRIA